MRPAYHCGLLLLHQGKFDDAEKEFTSVLAKDPKHAPSLLQRGNVNRRRGDHRAAVADYTAALEHGGPAIPLHFARGDAHAKAGDAAAAGRDFETANKIEPKTPEDFTARGLQLVKSDPSKSIELFNRAVELNAYYLPAWHNKAYVYSERLREWDLALETITKVAELAPSFAPSRAGRAVLLARLGKRDEAHADIQKALLYTADPEIVYQAACVYALTSASNADDREPALKYFRQCFRDGFRNFAAVEHDEDLKVILKLTEFKNVFEAAKNLVK